MLANLVTLGKSFIQTARSCLKMGMVMPPGRVIAQSQLAHIRSAQNGASL